MDSKSSEPAKAGSRRSGVSTAEKRAEYARLGLEWPKYPDGTGMWWQKDVTCVAGGCWASWEAVLRKRESKRLRNNWLYNNDEDYRLRQRSRHKEKYATDEQYRSLVISKAHDYYHLPDGGWMKARLRALSAQRATITTKLEELRELEQRYS